MDFVVELFLIIKLIKQIQNQNNYSIFEYLGSGGEIQLKNLSILNDIETPIIILDEADSNINEKRLNEIYRFLEKDKTIVIITHRDKEKILSKYDDIKNIVLKNGNLENN